MQYYPKDYSLPWCNAIQAGRDSLTIWRSHLHLPPWWEWLQFVWSIVKYLLHRRQKSSEIQSWEPWMSEGVLTCILQKKRLGCVGVPFQNHNTWCVQSVLQLSHKLFSLRFIMISPQSLQLNTTGTGIRMQVQDTRANNIPSSMLFSYLSSYKVTQNTTNSLRRKPTYTVGSPDVTRVITKYLLIHGKSTILVTFLTLFVSGWLVKCL